MPEPTRSPELTALGQEFFETQNTIDPLSATLLGIAGYDHLLPDPTRAGSIEGATRLRSIEDRLDALVVRESLGEPDTVDASVLSRLAWGARTDLEEGIWERDASAEGYASPHAMVFMCVPAASLPDADAEDAYLTRLGGLGEYFDRIRERYAEATSQERFSTRAGIVRAVDQLQGHLDLPLDEDTLANPPAAHGTAGDRFTSTARGITERSVRPAMRRLAAYMSETMTGLARDDDHVGICFTPGGDASYRAAVRRQTTTDLSPEEIHAIGLERVDELRGEFSRLGASALGESDVTSVLRRLREDRTLRFSSSEEIVRVASDALDRAEAARDDWFPPYRIAPCVIEEVHPIEARNAALAHYRPPAGDGSRPGAHCILTLDPSERFRYEYEALSFHESSPGHHLQIATAQSLTELPTYRRFLDTQVCAFVEGWGLYSERLADEMGLYTSDLARLGMLSFDALRACRLVVDTGMHHFGWSRRRAIDYMWQNTATTHSNVENEIDRYIGWPGQALAYMIGRREIQRLRAHSQQQLGARFSIREFHGVVLGNGAVPLDVLDLLVTKWIARVGPGRPTA